MIRDSDKSKKLSGSISLYELGPRGGGGLGAYNLSNIYSLCKQTSGKTPKSKSRSLMMVIETKRNCQSKC